MQSFSEALLPRSPRTLPGARIVAAVFIFLGVCGLVTVFYVDQSRELPEQDEFDLASFGDATCYKFTGGTCTIQDCDADRKAICDGGILGSHKCVCPYGKCVDRNGNCGSHRSSLVASSIRLRNVQYNRGLSVDGSPGEKQTWDLYMLPGRVSSYHRKYYLTEAGRPDRIVGLKDLVQSKVWNCMTILSPGIDPQQIDATICKPKDINNSVAFYYADVTMKDGDILVCTQGQANAYNVGASNAWTIEPMTPEIHEWMSTLPRCSKSWFSGALTYSVKSAENAWHALMANAPLMNCLNSLPYKWSFDGLMQEVKVIAVDPANAMGDIYNTYLKGMLTSVESFASRPIFNCTKTTQTEICFLGDAVDFTSPYFIKELTKPIQQLLDTLGDVRITGPLGCLDKYVLKPAFNAATTSLSTIVVDATQPIYNLIECVKQSIPFHEDCLVESDPPATCPFSSFSKAPGRRLLGLEGVTLPSLLNIFFGGISTFFEQKGPEFMQDFPQLVQREANHQCLELLEKKIYQSDDIVSELAQLPFDIFVAVVHHVLKHIVMPTLQTDFFTPAFNGFQRVLTIATNDVAQTATGLAGLLPNVGGPLASSMMGTITASMEGLSGKMVTETLHMVRCMLKQVIDLISKTLKKFLRKVVKWEHHWMDKAKEAVDNEVKAHSSDEMLPFLPVIVQVLFSGLAPKLKELVSSEANDCTKLINKISNPVPPSI